MSNSSFSKMESLEFTVKLEKLNVLKENLEKIKDVFYDVEITIEDSETKNTTKHDWVKVKGITKGVCEKAKDYIVSLTDPEKTTLINVPESFHEKLLEKNWELFRTIQRETLVYLTILCKTCLKIQSNHDINAVIAETLITEEVRKLDGSKNVESKEEENSIYVNEGLRNFAFKLGYDNDDINKAAKKFINQTDNLNEDTLLQELVNICPEKLKSKVIKSVTIKSKESLVVKQDKEPDLREIIIDGSNVAMCHGNKEIFSCRGIDIVVDWFLKRGHKKVFAFVPQWRLENPKPDSPILNQEILHKLDKEKHLVFTPSRNINGRRVACYDDRFMVKYAIEKDGIIVSNDLFRDLQKESTEWKIFLEQHLLMFTFVQDSFMPPDDPLGRSGPNLTEFLQKGSILSQICPYRNKCTFGTKCRFYHPQSLQQREQETNKERLNELLNPSNDIEKHKTGFDLRNNRALVSSESRYRKDRHTEAASDKRFQPMHCGLQMRMHSSSNDFQLREDDVIARGTSLKYSNDVNRRHSDKEERYCNSSLPPSHYEQNASMRNHAEINNLHHSRIRHERFNTPHSVGVSNLPSSDVYSLSTPPYERYHSYSAPMSHHPSNAPVASLTLGFPNQTHSPNPYVYSTNPSGIQTQYSHSQVRVPYDEMTGQNYQQFYQSRQTHHSTNTYQPQTQNSHYHNSPVSPVFNRDVQHSIDGHLFQMLRNMFPGQDRKIQYILYKYPGERDVNKLCTYILSEP